ncbi:MAG: FAD-dependent oxidoreductase, partial [Variovorax sp.]
MIRLSEIKLPLDPPADALPRAVQGLLGVEADAVADIHVHKRSFDARKVDLLQVYIVDVTLADPGIESLLLAKLDGNPRVTPSPDMVYRPPARAPADLPLRPVVVGFGPCGIFCALMLAQMGFKPIVLERGKTVRQRT